MRGMQSARDEAQLRKGADAVIAAAVAMPREAELALEEQTILRAIARGYFSPDEDDLIRVRYMQYLSLRAGLLETLAALEPMAGRNREWRSRLHAFVVAFACGCLMARATGYLLRIAANEPVLWKKLDEEDARYGIPRKTFTTIFRDAARARRLRLLRKAAEFYHEHRSQIRALAIDPEWAPLVILLEEEEAFMPKRKRDAAKRVIEYRWFSFLRRHRSAWRQVMFGMFRFSGSAIAELRQPGVKPAGALKRVSDTLRKEVVQMARPGDIFLTRHDDALSNLFLPGFWPHAALYIGSCEQRDALGLQLEETRAHRSGGSVRFLEAKKDGVRFRAAEETLQVDAFLILRPPHDEGGVREALHRAIQHEGKLYDFLFDFRASDRLACTAVVYRGYHGVGGLCLELEEVGGRLCLPAEALLEQCLAAGFQIVAVAGVDSNDLCTGDSAVQAAWRSSTRLKRKTPTENTR